MPTRKRSSQPDPSQPDLGDFGAEGNWIPSSDPSQTRSARYHFIDMLVSKRRQDPSCPPSTFAARIRRSPFLSAFPSVSAGLWELDAFSDFVWPPYCRTAAEFAVHRSGSRLQSAPKSPAHPHDDPAYARFRLDLVHQILDQHLKPLEVAAWLQLHSQQFLQIPQPEINHYKFLDTSWNPPPNLPESPRNP